MNATRSIDVLGFVLAAVTALAALVVGLRTGDAAPLLLCTVWAVAAVFGWQRFARSRFVLTPPYYILGQILFVGGGGTCAVLALAYMSAQRALSLYGASAALMVVGLGRLVMVVSQRRYARERQERRILAHEAAWGQATQPEGHVPTPECPRPEQWKMFDPMSAEVEVLEFLETLVVTLKPRLIVETGTFTGLSTLAFGRGLARNGSGTVVTCEADPEVFARAKARFAASPVASYIDCRNELSLDMQVSGEIDLLFCDSALEVREAEIRRFLPQMSARGIILAHDASSHHKVVREAIKKLEAEGLVSGVLLPTPRGLAIAQRKAGRG